MIRSKTKGSVWRRKVPMDDQDKIGQKTAKMSKRITMDNSGKKGEKYQLLSYHQLPDYMKDNEYILHYYRANWPIKQALFSLFSWHNETLNVWTHLLGFLLFVGLTVSNLVDMPQMAEFITMITEQYPESDMIFNNLSSSSLVSSTNNTSLSAGRSTKYAEYIQDSTGERWPLVVFLCGAMLCLLWSSSCHLFSCHSKRLNTQLLHLDYVGITVMIITSFFPPIYYVFECQPKWQLIYLGCITAMGACTVIALLSPALSSGKHRTLRALLFVSMGLFGVVPAAHALVINWDHPHRNITLAYEGAMALSYLLGTTFYVGRFPERWRPGWFDLAGHSHQIFHVFVVLGALAHYGAARIFLIYRPGIGIACGQPINL
ncbi:adiponectin receptor protein [Striga asiatica]|uniref:Adiponectin receptor protein n=1 Tax=Striga asiatica TaxID=4170 RepID=A0A5A7R2M6_STRAF|nr:adiponectin receptor protein [Striga asiatica]